MKNLLGKSLEQLLDLRDDICKCDRCRADMVMRTMDNLPARYMDMITEGGHVSPEFNDEQIQLTATVIRELMDAIDHIARSPDHETEPVPRK
jgi:competence protein ComFB